jgi:hypothetical protein
MSEKSFKIVNGDISDGYHTFDELYEHRCLLFLLFVTGQDLMGAAYAVLEHYEGWDLITYDSPEGQISYHVSTKYRHLWSGTLMEIPIERHKFDGHTPTDVVMRMMGILADRRSEALQEAEEIEDDAD